MGRTKDKDLTTPEDRQILSKPPPPSLIFCKLLTTLKKINFDDPNRPNGYLKCKVCPDHMECIRYIEAGFYKRGTRITRHVWNEKEKAYYRRLHDERDSKASVLL